MNVYVALLRGINVSGQKKIPMAELRQLLTQVGFENVQTYIQSGNVIFQCADEKSCNMALKIHETIKTHFGFDVSVLVKTPSQLQKIFNDSPFSEEKKEYSYFTFLYTVPDNDIKADVSKIAHPNEEFIITDNCVYFYCSTGYGRAKCNNNFFERKLKIIATARNYKTMVKLLSLSTEI